MLWQPITLEAVYDEILKSEEKMTGEVERFWKLIQIFPEKWQQYPYGDEGGGGWVVAICGRNIIWYNDIEEGFNISPYDVYGQFVDYWCNQDPLTRSVQELLDMVKMGGDELRRAGPPEDL